MDLVSQLRNEPTRDAVLLAVRQLARFPDFQLSMALVAAYRVLGDADAAKAVLLRGMETASSQEAQFQAAAEGFVLYHDIGQHDSAAKFLSFLRANARNDEQFAQMVLCSATDTFGRPRPACYQSALEDLVCLKPSKPSLQASQFSLIGLIWLEHPSACVDVRSTIEQFAQMDLPPAQAARRAWVLGRLSGRIGRLAQARELLGSALTFFEGAGLHDDAALVLLDMLEVEQRRGTRAATAKIVGRMFSHLRLAVSAEISEALRIVVRAYSAGAQIIGLQLKRMRSAFRR